MNIDIYYSILPWVECTPHYCFSSYGAFENCFCQWLSSVLTRYYTTTYNVHTVAKNGNQHIKLTEKTVQNQSDKFCFNLAAPITMIQITLPWTIYYITSHCTVHYIIHIIILKNNLLKCSPVSEASMFHRHQTDKSSKCLVQTFFPQNLYFKKSKK